MSAKTILDFVMLACAAVCIFLLVFLALWAVAGPAS